MRLTSSIRILLLIPASAFSSYAFSAEHAVPCEKMPSAVQEYSKTLVSRGAVLRGCVKEISRGKTTYELETQTNTGRRDVTITSEGVVLEVEEQVAQESLPAPVSAAFEKARQGGSLVKIESLTRAGAIVGYEATKAKNGKQHEIGLRPDGTPAKAD